MSQEVASGGAEYVEAIAQKRAEMLAKRVRIIQGDCRDVLRTLPDESVHCVVTSPPYWGLRDYGVAGQLGLEPTYQEHITKLVDVFREVRRVMRKDATLWLNYGDCYATAPNGRSAADTKALGNDDRTFRDKPFSTVGGVLKPKDLCGMPWRVALALQEDGWWLRRDIIWSKPNAMPESIDDRPATAHEYLFLLSKSARYHYDADAVRTPHETPIKARALKAGRQAMRGQEAIRPRGNLEACAAPEKRYYAEGGRNLRSVWTVATEPFSEAHFATFPRALVEPCIKAGCPVGGVVLDPFGGSGTVGLVASKLGRDAILIELNPAYVEMATGRLRTKLVDVDAPHTMARGLPLLDAIA